MSDLVITKIGNTNREYFSGMLAGEKTPGSVELGAIRDGRPVGCAVVSFDGEVAFIDHIYVVEDKRRQGIGRTLMERIGGALRRSGIYTALIYFDEQPGIKEFLASTGFKCAPSMIRYSVGIEDLVIAEKKGGLKKKVEGIKVMPADNLASSQVAAFKEALAKGGFDPSAMEAGNYDPKLSFATIDGQTPRAVLLADTLGEDYIVKVLASFAKSMDGVALMGAFLDAVKGSPDSLIQFYLVDEKPGEFIGNVLGNADLIMEEAVDWSGIRRFDPENEF